MNILDITLALTPRIGPHVAADLIDRFGSVEAIFDLSEYELAYKSGLAPAVARDIAKRIALDEARKELEYCNHHNITILAATDPDYPALLKYTNDYPHILYVAGDSSLLNKNLVAFIGTRKISPYGETACSTIIEQLAERVDNLVIVSGLAYGVDAAAHRSALQNDIPTIAVLPSALPNVSPAHHTELAREILRRGGALISEQRSTFRNVGRALIPRNRIVAGISSAVVVVESPLKGGSMSTASIANKIGRPLAAVPGRITDTMSAGCNQLITEARATPITHADDILRILDWSPKEPSATPTNTPSALSLSDAERGLLLCFRHDEPLHIETLEELSQLTAGELLCLLVTLEMAGYVRTLGGSMYERTIPYSDIK